MHDITNEQYLAGCILIEPAVLSNISKIVSGEDFQCDYCRSVFEAAKHISSEGKTIDPLSIKAFAQQKGIELHIEFLAQLMEIVPTSASASDYAERVAEDSRKRRIKVLAEQIQSDQLSTSGQLLELLKKETNEIANSRGENSDSFLALFKPLSDFEEEEATWLIPGWVPESQITLVAADGGIGKTTLWCHILSSMSNGERCVLDPPMLKREPLKIAFCTTEDSVKKKLRKKLRESGANLSNIITFDASADKTGLLRDFKFGSEKLNQFVRYHKPALCVFDPVQGFIPPKVNMGSRNEMRDCMAPLIALGEETGTTFMVICHTNKRTGASGRNRVADSADLWDISRSVIMAGYTEDPNIRYLSNEKNNYSQLQETVLFSIDKAGQIITEGTTWKRDRDYMQDSLAAKKAPKRDDCKDFILHTLEMEPSQCIKSNDLVESAKRYGYSCETIKRARKELKNDGKIENYSIGSSKAGDRVWYIRIVSKKVEDYVELPEDTPLPFDYL